MKGGRRGCARVYGTGPQKRVPGLAACDQSFDPDLTHKFLQDPHAQRFIIDQLLKEAETHGFDGINIDFENIYEKDRDALTSFMAYLRRQSQKKGLILSMDVTAPSRNPNWSRCYDRKALTKSVDYLVLMTYDQIFSAE